MASQFSVLLRQLRAQSAMKQEELAERSGVSVRTIRRLETGESANPQSKTVRLLADALGLEPGERTRLLALADGQTSPESPAGHASRDLSDGQAKPRLLMSPSASTFERRLAEAANDLAYAVGARWRREEELRRIEDPFPLPVRWRPAPEELTDHPENIDRALPGELSEPLDLAGRLDEIVDIYRQIPSGRLVVLGRVGSGKTILAIRFVLDLLRTRTGAGAVPVVFSLGSWNPTTTVLRDWLIGQLVRDYPGLAAIGSDGSTLAAALVGADRILPVLDGFDEIAAGLHQAALEALNTFTLPLLLTSRPVEYAAAVAETDVLTAAAVIELTDLTVTDLVDYLPRTTRKTAATATTPWDPVLNELRDRPHGPLAAVLTTPLMVGLARAIYSDTRERDPSALLDTNRFGTPEAVEDHLLGSFVPTVYRSQPENQRWDPDRVQRWLGFLALHLTRLGTRDLAWWQLGGTMRRWPRMVVVGFVAGVPLAFAAGIAVALMDWLGVGTAGSGFAAGVADGFTTGLKEGVATGLTVGLAHGVALVVGGAAFAPSRVHIQFHGGRRRPRAFLRRFTVGLAMGLGLASALAIAGGFGLRFWIVGRLASGTEYGVLFGLALGLVIGVVWGLMARLEVPVDIRSAVSPTDLLNTNRATVVFQSTVLGLVCAVGYGIVAGLLHGPWYGLVNGVSYGVVLGLAVGSGAALSLTAWGQWVALSRVWLPLTGRLPWAVTAFLDDACRRGVLRQAGAVYQFRHARLQDHLTHPLDQR